MSDAAILRFTPRSGSARKLSSLLTVVLALAACQSPASELSGLSERPPLNYSVLVTGGAFLQLPAGGGRGTFSLPTTGETVGGHGEPEVLGVEEILGVLREGAVFQRVGVDPDDSHRREVLRKLQSRSADSDLLDFLQSARDSGYDLLLVVEQLQDNPIDAQGINGRWPVTLATWLLLGLGVLIPDHTFESGATLRVTMRDLQTGGVVFDALSTAGPVDLSLIERGNALGLLLSIVVPPFWVHDDQENVDAGVRDVTRRRLLLSLARDLKSEPTRQRLREGQVAAMTLAERRLLIDAAESVSAVRLRAFGGAVDPDVVRRWERDLLASLRRDEAHYVYEAELPRQLDGAVQVLVSTITGSVSSATFVVVGAQ